MRINPQNDSEDRHGPILQMAERRLRRIKSLLRASQLVETDRGRIHLRQVHPTAALFLLGWKASSGLPRPL